ncbi:MAG: hypothetical protein AAFV07_02750 [Bacteroidota bacterium]
MFAIRTTITLFCLSLFAVCCLHLAEIDPATPFANLFQLDVLGWHMLYATGLTAMSWLFFGMVYILRFLATRIDLPASFDNKSSLEQQEAG